MDPEITNQLGLEFEAQPPESLTANFDRTVHRVERHLEQKSLGGGGGEQFGYHGDDILPEAAEDMGPGQCMIATLVI